MLSGAMTVPIAIFQEEERGRRFENLIGGNCVGVRQVDAEP